MGPAQLLYKSRLIIISFILQAYNKSIFIIYILYTPLSVLYDALGLAAVGPTNGVVYKRI